MNAPVLVRRVNRKYRYLNVFSCSLSCRKAYENCIVLEARICYNVAKLMALNSER